MDEQEAIEETYSYLASDGNTYGATFFEILEWYTENRLGPDDVVTENWNQRQKTVREVLDIPQQSAEQSAKPPVRVEESVANPAPNIRSGLTKAILSTVCAGCLPIGIVAVVFAAQVDGFQKRREYDLAQDAADKADKWANWSFGIGIAWILLCMAVKCSQ